MANFPASYSGYTGLESTFGHRPTGLHSYDFPQYIKTNAGAVHLIRTQPLLPRSFQHKIPSSSYHSMLQPKSSVTYWKSC